jgi:ubiquinone/menaquinone biosynthesis C-methylase UbiE
MLLKNIIDILADPINKEKFNIKDNKLVGLENSKQYLVENNVIHIIPNEQIPEKYVEHYSKDAILFDYFVENPKVTADDERRLHEIIIDELNFSKKNNDTILDVGSGGGWAANSLIKKCKRFISVDISAKNLEAISKKINSECFFAVQADGLRLPFVNDGIERIISSEVIEHIVDTQKFIEELYRILKPSGRIIISTPYKERLQYYLCVHCNEPTPKNAHLHSFDEQKLLQLTNNCFNAKVTFKIFGNKALHILRFYVILQFMPLFLWKLIDKLANLVIKKPQHIIMIIEKPDNYLAK